jgi:DNA invertase Pin-like site-specific DNA recombinase
MSPALPSKLEMDIIKMIMDEVPTKEIAYRLGISVDPVYRIRDKYFKVKYVLKRHPKDTFKLT